jgi:hypothetical protein
MKWFLSSLSGLAVASAIAFAPAITATSAQAGRLIAVTDGYSFNGLSTSALSTVMTSGSSVLSGPVVTPTSYPLNGIGAGPGYLFGGDPYSTTLRTLSYNGTLLSSTTAAIQNGCCNEQYAYLGGNLYHAQYGSGGIQEITTSGAFIANYAQNDAVGITDVNGTIWITHWGARQVGAFNPGTDTFTPMFTTSDVAGALAFDPASQILWVGGSNRVSAYTLSGTLLSSYEPFSSADTIDGLAFVAAPESSTWAMLLMGFGGLALAGYRTSRKSVASVA